MRPFFRCRHCNKRLVPLVQRFGHYLGGRERICPKCGKIWRLTPTAHQTLIALGVVVGIVFIVEMHEWLRTPDGDLLLLILWLPLYVFVLWPAMFALLGNYRMK